MRSVYAIRLLSVLLGVLVLAALVPAAILPAGSGGSVDPHAPRPGDWQRNCRGKPSPPIGDVELVIVERLSPDRLILEARWGKGRDETEGTVELVLPDGAWVLEGPDRHVRARKRTAGVSRWIVEHRVGEPLDAVARLRRDVGGRRRAREACVRLEFRRQD